jgi:hypothetical protein
MVLTLIQEDGRSKSDANSSALPSALVAAKRPLVSGEPSTRFLIFFVPGRLWGCLCGVLLPLPAAVAQLSVQPTNGGVVVSWQMPGCWHPTNCLAYQMQWSENLSFRPRCTWWIGEDDGRVHRRFFPVAPSTALFFRVVAVPSARKRRRGETLKPSHAAKHRPPGNRNRPEPSPSAGKHGRQSWHSP